MHQVVGSPHSHQLCTISQHRTELVFADSSVSFAGPEDNNKTRQYRTELVYVDSTLVFAG